MQIGTMLIAPNGYMSLERGITYYFLRSNRVTGAVLLVVFSQNNPPKAALTILSRREFEAGLVKKMVQEASNSTGLPPFLESLRGFNFETLDQLRPNASKPLRQHVEERLLKITPLLQREEQILNAISPEREINAYANANGLNSQRIRLWFFTYLCFGRNIWTLIPLFFRAGRWDRAAQTEGPKLGRPSIARGPQSGARLTLDAVEKIVDSYMRLRKPGKYLTHIFDEAMATVFRAVPITDDSGRKRLISSDGQPLPTYNQYRYQLHKHLGQSEVQRSLYGNARYRRRFAEHTGQFASAVSNLYESMEADGYYCTDRPKGYIEGAILPPLCVVRGVDTASALRLGIGFSFEKESSTAYNAMLFCAAIPKKKFCQLFGINIEEHEWPSQGLPTRYITDRGPGIKRERGEKYAIKHDGIEGIVIRELTPSGQGQSKSIVESAQRRTLNLEEPAQLTLSTLTPYQMALREIRRVLKENQSADASSRLTSEMIQSDVFPNPLGIWGFLDDRARNDGQLIAFDDAVRRFLKPIELQGNRAGVWLEHQKYDSKALRETGLIEKIGRTGPCKVKGYMYPFCIRYLWIEEDGLLVEVNAQLELRDDETQLFRSYEELLQEDTASKVNKAELQQHQRAASVEQMQGFERDTGQKWQAGKSHAKLSKMKSRSSKRDADDIKTVFEGRTRE